MPWFFLDCLQEAQVFRKVPLEVFLLLFLLQSLLLSFFSGRNKSNDKKKSGKEEEEEGGEDHILMTSTSKPWLQEVIRRHSSAVLRVQEWRSEDFRRRNGWRGKDFMHSRTSPVRIFDYFLLSSDQLELQQDQTMETDFALTGCVYFSARAESHQGLCHGGTMCACMDDAIGWLGFCESGKCIPWSGYTVQVDTSLKKAIEVGSYLKLDVWIERRESARKIRIACRLYNPETGDIHAEGKGLFLKNIKKETKKNI